MDELTEVLERARTAGFLGDGPIAPQVAHAEAMAGLLPSQGPLADLGTGGGLPGLVVAQRHQTQPIVLVEASQRRADHLTWAVARLGWGTRVAVVARPAELVGRDPRHRGQYQGVTARSFGPPSAVAEVAAPLLAPDGVLVVAEPPRASVDRWAGLRDGPLPLVLEHLVEADAGHFACLRMVGTCPERFPRSVGVPVRRPLWAQP